MARFVIGIDLGTTNSAVAFADLRELTAGAVPRVRVFEVPQVVAPGEVATRPTLPSFLYVLNEDERAFRQYGLPWEPDPPEVVGTWARDHGAMVPGRLVTSAKSWLCNAAVDRRARILPWGEDTTAWARSPVESSRAFVDHVRAAWNQAMASGPAGDDLRFERQVVVLTVPASFDQEARALTVEAASHDGLVLLEEPTAALYTWIAAEQPRGHHSWRDAEHVLVCDVGGGTTDFTLVRVRVNAEGEPVFERTAVGHHLLLGGDNLDLAIVDLVEEQLGRPRLTLRQRQALRRQCAAAKETLLGPPPVDRVALSVLGAGASVVGGALVTEVTRVEVLRLLLDGFLPECDLDATPSANRRAGLRELGLPFASDPAITRHLAAFLREAGGDAGPVRPDAVLFNGGFFTPAEARGRVVSVITRWFDRSNPAPPLRILANPSPATAVAEGAACFGLARQGYGMRIGGGSPRAFYLALGAADGGTGHARAICVLPRGTAEGTTARLDDRQFTVTTNRPRAFTLLSSLTGQSRLGEVIEADPDVLHRHAPLVTELRFGKRTRHADIQVALEVTYTELGILELSLRAPDTGHRWGLHFQLRAATRDGAGTSEVPAASVADATLASAMALVREVFTEATTSPDTLMARLEGAFGFAKQAWPVATVRPIADALLAEADGRRRSPRHEARWLNLLGYCLRPGFGATLDDHRMTQARRVYLAGLAHPDDVQCQAEWLVLWQRVAGGLSPGQQREMFDRHVALLGVGTARRARRVPPQVEREGLRLLASLEYVPPQRRATLGDDLLDRLRRDRRNASLLWAIGRTGARTPAHGPLNTVVAPARVQAWIERLLDLVPVNDDLVVTLVELAARTGDPARDLDAAFARSVHDRLVARGVAASALVRLIDIHEPSADEQQRVYGESLPEGLRLVEQSA